jgi:hypothetical protein
VRSLTAIICLTAFFALQYGNLVNYWHCRIASIYTSTPCDCVQQLLDNHKDTTHHSSAILKEKTEEVVLFHEQLTNWQPTETAVTYEVAYFDAIPEAYFSSVFQPPKYA